MGKYFGYVAIIVGIYILLCGLSLFSMYFDDSIRTSYTAIGTLVNSTNFVTFTLISAVVSIIGLMISYYGWKWVQSAKTIESTSERVGENVANVFRKYAAPSNPKIENIDQYLDKIDKREDLDLDKFLKK